MWIYLSPHLDDAVYSCGGVIWSQIQKGEKVEVWTVCAGDPPTGPLSPFARSLHERWGTGREAVSIRREEDKKACEVLGAAFKHFAIPDCIYRRHDENGDALYAGEDAIFGHFDPREAWLLDSLTKEIFEMLPEGANLVGPMGIGGHVDHQLVTGVLERILESNTSIIPNRKRPVLWRYADVPYILNAPASLQAQVVSWGLERYPAPASGQRAWVEAMACYKSQLNSFWPSVDVMSDKIEAYVARMGGAFLWKE